MQTVDQQIAALKRALAAHVASGDTKRAKATQEKLAKLRSSSEPDAPAEAEPAPKTRRAKGDG